MFNLFDEYRICAMKLKFFPNVTANATITQFYVPIFVANDVNSTSLVVVTAANTLDYENCKVFNVQRPWKYYRKMQKNIAYTTTANSIPVKGYIPTDSARPTQSFQILFNSPTALTAGNYGTFVLTYYVVARSRN